VRALLDVNVLLALFDPEHKHHDDAVSWWTTQQDQGWASCPMTQNGFVRVISNPAYKRPLPLAGAVTLMQAQAARPGHVFWPDDISFTDAGLFDHGRLQGPNQITDAYLLALAVRNRGCLATFDRGIALDAVRGAKAEHVVIL
jgi:toxin-antitoxin system PIN domain toxin